MELSTSIITNCVYVYIYIYMKLDVSLLAEQRLPRITEKLKLHGLRQF